MENSIARNKIATMYNQIREFRTEKLNTVVNEDLSEACKEIPGLGKLKNELFELLLNFELKVLKFADDNYPAVKG